MSTSRFERNLGDRDESIGKKAFKMCHGTLAIRADTSLYLAILFESYRRIYGTILGNFSLANADIPLIYLARQLTC